MGLGYGLAFGAEGASDAYSQLRDLVAKQQQQAFENSQTLRQQDRADRSLDQQDQLTRLKIAEAADARSAVAQDRATGLANALGDQIPAGTVVQPSDPIVGMLRSGGRGSLLQHQDPTLASTQYTGASTLPDASGTPIIGSLRMTQSAGNPEQYLKLPSQKQQDTATEQARKSDATDAAIQARVEGLNQAAQRLEMQGKVNEANIARAQAEAALANAKATQQDKGKPLTLSAQGKSAKAAIENAGPLTDQAMQMMRDQFPGIDTDSNKYNGLIDKASALYHAGKYYTGFGDPNDPRQQIVSLLQPIQAGQYTRSSRSRQMLELALAHMADMKQTPSAQYQRLKDLRSIMPEMEEGIVRAEQPVDASNPLGGTYFDPANQTPAPAPMAPTPSKYKVTIK